MSEIALCAQACLIEGWYLTHAIRLGEADWQVNITDDEHVCVATGETIEYALIAAQAKALEGKFVGQLFHLSSKFIGEKSLQAGRSLLASLGLTKPPSPIKRRI